MVGVSNLACDDGVATARHRHARHNRQRKIPAEWRTRRRQVTQVAALAGICRNSGDAWRRMSRAL
jgi:hypothetical protein